MKTAQSYIAGNWYRSKSGTVRDVINPATEEPMGRVEAIDAEGLDLALSAAAAGFETWKKTSAYDRARLIRDAVAIIRSRKEEIARIMTEEQGKPLAEAMGEVMTSADNMEWIAEEATRAYGRLLVPRNAGINQVVRREPIGPVAAFCPWNFPALTPMRKIGGALAAGCSIILKPSEETPFTALEIVRAFIDAGLPANVLNLVYGSGQMVSSHLIASPVIRKITFTGSTPVGKELLAQAATSVKRATMELGGHAPVFVFDDVDPIVAAQQAVQAKFRNAGQVCTSPTRFYVQKSIYPAFVKAFAEAASGLRVGNGLEKGAQMGPLANIRAVRTMESFVADAQACGARLECGGERMPGNGYFFPPTVFSDVPESARIMNDEPFGPVVPIASFETIDEALQKANRLPFGLAAYVMTRSLSRANIMSEGIEAGMVCINHFTVSTPSSPFGGVKESGYGSEGGVEGLDAYLVVKSVTTRSVGPDL